ncbi:LysM peptidoglycan-binding domain-containing protein [Bacillus sp. 1P10SD]|uniref:LysM peptidoglycan-binding and 3D domain-containing protein n=1 Tax=Bacillus sp. 1P10SD TaxID=3132265 RepID=UPI0039A62FED
MIKKIKTFIAVVALSGTVGANVKAAELTVQDGDTLWDLSRVHNTSVENIQKWNHLSTDLIHPGDVLTIATEKQYTVVKDDTLWDIAKEYQVSVAMIKEWNKLNTDLIHPGLQLVIYDEINNFSSGKMVETAKTPVVSKAPEVSTKESNTSKSEETKVEAAPTSVASKPEVPVTTKVEETSKEITVKATAYTASCEGCSGTTATGLDLNANPGAKVIAVDPSVIPLGSKVLVEGYGEAIASDTGGAIKGNRIDVFIPSEEKALEWGKKEIKVKILD